MMIKIGLISSSSQLMIRSLDTKNASFSEDKVGLEQLPTAKLNLLFFSQIEEAESIAQELEKWQDIFPIVEISSIDQTAESFAGLNYPQLKEAFDKINTRWILSKNLHTVENLCQKTKELKDLWVKNRDEFFKTLWQVFKSNLAAVELTFVFHDLKEPTEAGKEKGEKAKLIYTRLTGSHYPEQQPCTEFEENVIQDYKSEFNEVFTIAEFKQEQGELVICTQLEKSPILVMAKVNSLNQLQKSLLSGLMQGLQIV